MTDRFPHRRAYVNDRHNVSKWGGGGPYRPESLARATKLLQGTIYSGVIHYGFLVTVVAAREKPLMLSAATRGGTQ